MMRISHLLLLMTLGAVSLPAMTIEQDGSSSSPPISIPLWENGAPGAKGESPGDQPGLRYYPAPEDRTTGALMVVCPGGGYRHLAPHEGHEVALWLNQLGISAVVLQYRLGPTYQHPAMLQDVQRAVRLVRSRAVDWKIDARRIGIMGFSAGGHLASTAATWFDDGDSTAEDPVERMSSRPDLAVLCYPVITMHAPTGHAGSRRHLLGENPTPELIDRLSSERQVSGRTPPTFLFHTADDAAVPVENSLLFAAALRRVNVPYELHIYESGRHGVGLAQDHPTLGSWPGLLASWLRSRGFTR